ncbi:hypothetical protein [Streptomyces sp. NPDC000983]
MTLEQRGLPLDRRLRRWWAVLSPDQAPAAYDMFKAKTGGRVRAMIRPQD